MIEDMWSAIDFDSTIKDYEFTRKAMNEIHSVVYSGDFEDMDADMIFSYLREKMRLVSFRDYLRRYLYSAAQIKEPFYTVDDDVFRDIIMGSFEETGTPHSFEPTTKRWSAIVKSWLASESVRRPTVFLLGFGLRMTEEEVSEFLTKVIKEEDYNHLIPQEVVFCYCYQNRLPWSFARKKLDWYLDAAIEKDVLPEDLPDIKGHDEQRGIPDFFNEQELDRYLISLKRTQTGRTEDDISYSVFDQLLERAKKCVAVIYQDDEELGVNKTWKGDDISPADLEKIICCGIPMTSSGNLQKMSASLLNSHFHQKRISRQRIEKLIQRKVSVDRYDLITLLFFIYTQEMPDDEPEIRCKRYMDEINDYLRQCHMSGLYPVNAYEAFILMCLLSDAPLATYTEIWEMSYQQE